MRVMPLARQTFVRRLASGRPKVGAGQPHPDRCQYHMTRNPEERTWLGPNGRLPERLQKRTLTIITREEMILFQRTKRPSVQIVTHLLQTKRTTPPSVSQRVCGSGCRRLVSSLPQRKTIPNRSLVECFSSKRDLCLTCVADLAAAGHAASNWPQGGSIWIGAAEHFSRRGNPARHGLSGDLAQRAMPSLGVPLSQRCRRDIGYSRANSPRSIT